MKQKSKYFKLVLTVTATVALTLSCDTVVGQQKPLMVRLAKIVVDSLKLEEYKRYLHEGVETAMKKETGVLALYAVSDKAHPTHFTILEIYADSTAYLAHLQTPHFIKYKTKTKEMVRALELVETDPLIPDMKIKDFRRTKKSR